MQKGQNTQHRFFYNPDCSNEYSHVEIGIDDVLFDWEAVTYIEDGDQKMANRYNNGKPVAVEGIKVTPFLNMISEYYYDTPIYVGTANDKIRLLGKLTRDYGVDFVKAIQQINNMLDEVLDTMKHKGYKK